MNLCHKISIQVPEIRANFKIGWFPGTSPDDIKESIGKKVFRLIEQNLGAVQTRGKEILVDFWLEDEDGDEVVITDKIPSGLRFTFRSNSFFRDISPLVYVTDDVFVHILSYFDEKSLTQASLSNKRIRMLSSNDKLWAYFFSNSPFSMYWSKEEVHDSVIIPSLGKVSFKQFYIYIRQLGKGSYGQWGFESIKLHHVRKMIQKIPMNLRQEILTMNISAVGDNPSLFGWRASLNLNNNDNQYELNVTNNWEGACLEVEERDEYLDQFSITPYLITTKGVASGKTISGPICDLKDASFSWPFGADDREIIANWQQHIADPTGIDDQLTQSQIQIEDLNMIESITLEDIEARIREDELVEQVFGVRPIHTDLLLLIALNDPFDHAEHCNCPYCDEESDDEADPYCGFNIFQNVSDHQWTHS